jgi:DNA sulfur modification protein DndE
MKLTRVRFCEEADSRLRSLKARTGLSANLLCRVGFSLSLNDPTIPDPLLYPEDSPREIDRPTLTGQYDALFLALLRERCAKDELDLEGAVFEEQFRAHMNRGVLLLFHRVKGLADLAKLGALQSATGSDRADRNKEDFVGLSMVSEGDD